MTEHKIQWDLVGLLLVFLTGVLIMNFWPNWRKRREKKRRKGFRRMQSPAERNRHRGDGKWGR